MQNTKIFLFYYKAEKGMETWKVSNIGCNNQEKLVKIYLKEKSFWK